MCLLVPAVVLALVQAGCGWFGGDSFASYSADLSCGADIITAQGETGHEDFASSTTVEINAAGDLRVNGVAIDVGARVTRSLPAADLEFEVVAVDRNGDSITIAYEPRPSLPGITVDGQLIQKYVRQSGDLRATASANLTVTDIDVDTQITVNCEGLLIGE
jgi:hypothetical protein